MLANLQCLTTTLIQRHEELHHLQGLMKFFQTFHYFMLRKVNRSWLQLLCLSRAVRSVNRVFGGTLKHGLFCWDKFLRVLQYQGWVAYTLRRAEGIILSCSFTSAMIQLTFYVPCVSPRRSAHKVTVTRLWVPVTSSSDCVDFYLQVSTPYRSCIH